MTIEILGRQITPRESQIVRQLKQGRTNKAIAHELGLKVGTIKVYMSHLSDKLGGLSRLEIALLPERLPIRERDDT